MTDFGATKSWMDLIEEARSQSVIRKFDPTPEQIYFLRAGRSGKIPVSYDKLVRLWIKIGWEKVSEETLRRWGKDNIDDKGE